MAISRAQLLKELLPGLNALFGLQYATYGEEHKEIYETESSERSFEEETKLAGFGSAPVKNEGSAIAYDNAQEAFTARYNHETIALGFSITEYLDLFDKEGQIARDPNVVDTLGREEGLLGLTKTAGQAAVQRVIAKIPELKENLPEFQPYFSEKAPVRAGEFFNSLTGIRNVPEKGAVERVQGHHSVVAAGIEFELIQDRAVVQRVQHVGHGQVVVAVEQQQDQFPLQTFVLCLNHL